MSERTFTLDEAQMLLPILESLLKQAINGKKLIESVDNELQETAHRVFLNGGTLSYSFDTSGQMIDFKSSNLQVTFLSGHHIVIGCTEMAVAFVLKEKN